MKSGIRLAGLVALCAFGCVGCLARMNFEMSLDAAMDIQVTKFANDGDVLLFEDDQPLDDDAVGSDGADFPFVDMNGDGSTDSEALIDVDPQDIIDAVREIDSLISGDAAANSSGFSEGNFDSPAGNASWR